jgi:hypothetical protein
MNGPQTPPRKPRAHILLHEAAGAVMVLLGSLTLLGLVYISNDPAPYAENLVFSLGLALTSLISAGAQVLVLAGVAILWGAVRRSRRGS